MRRTSPSVTMELPITPESLPPNPAEELTECHICTQPAYKNPIINAAYCTACIMADPVKWYHLITDLRSTQVREYKLHGQWDTGIEGLLSERFDQFEGAGMHLPALVLMKVRWKAKGQELDRDVKTACELRIPDEQLWKVKQRADEWDLKCLCTLDRMSTEVSMSHAVPSLEAGDERAMGMTVAEANELAAEELMTRRLRQILGALEEEEVKRALYN